jgi:hypothetical protein
VTKPQKKLIRLALGALLAADLLLVIVNWQLDAAARPGNGELPFRRQQLALLSADIARARQIRADLPSVERQAGEFFQQHIAPAQSGYSALVEDVGQLAEDAEVRAENLTFRQGTPDARGVVQVEIGATVNGEYANIVRFINGLEHSDTFYVLDGLQLTSGTTGGLRLNLRLRTYFRTVA